MGELRETMKNLKIAGLWAENRTPGILGTTVLYKWGGGCVIDLLLIHDAFSLVQV
jgi:hypothetical protein